MSDLNPPPFESEPNQVESGRVEFMGRVFSPSPPKVICTIPFKDDSTAFEVSNLIFGRTLFLGEQRELWLLLGRLNGGAVKRFWPLSLFLFNLPRSTYPIFTSRMVSAIWDANGSLHSEFSAILKDLICVAVGDKNGLKPTAAGLWPDFDGDWERIIRFSKCLRSHFVVSYFRFCYVQYPKLRSRISNALDLVPEPYSERVFIEACASFWAALCYSSEEADITTRNVLEALLARDSQKFHVFPAGDFRSFTLEKYLKLFSADRYEFLQFVLKLGKQGLAEIAQLNFDGDLGSKLSEERLWQSKLRSAIEWCENEIAYTKNSVQIPVKKQSRPIAKRDRYAPYTRRVAELARVLRMTEHGVRKALTKGTELAGVQVRHKRNGTRGLYLISERSFNEVKKAVTFR